MLTNLTILLSVVAIFLVVIWAIRNDAASGADEQTGLFAMKREAAQDLQAADSKRDRQGSANSRLGRGQRH